MRHSPATEQTSQPEPAQRSGRAQWYLGVAVILLIVAAFFRLWDLGSVPPGMHAEELVNVQISDRLRDGDVSVIYDEVSPGREGLYYAFLAAATTFIGRGIILWRLPSVWMAMLSLAFMVQLVRRLFGVRVSLLAVGLAAVSFWPVWMGRSVQHVALLPLASTVAVYAMVRAFAAQKRTASSLWFTVGGLALGVAQYVHVTAWSMFLLFGLFIIYHWVVNRAGLKQHLSNILYALILALVLCLPLFIFLVRHPGVREPFPLAEQIGLIAQIPARLISALAALGLRGDMLPYHNLPGRPVFGVLMGGLFLIGCGVALARWRSAPYGAALLWLVVGLLPSLLLSPRPDFEYMAVVMPILYVFPAIGLRAVFGLARKLKRPLLKRLGTSFVTLIVAGLLTGTAVETFRDYFIVWPTLGDVRLNYQADLGLLAHYLDTSDDLSPASICSVPVDKATDPFALTNEELLDYLMHRHDLPVRYFDCTQSIVLADGGSSQRLIFPRSHYYGDLPGDLLLWLQSAQDEGVPGIRPDVIMRLEIADDLAAFAGAFTSEALAAWPPPPESALEGIAVLPVQFEHNITFLGYEIRDEILRPGDWIELTTYWRVDGPPPPELTVFAHMLSNPVVVVAQTDTLGVDPTTLQVRDVFVQQTMIRVPEGLSEGQYPLSVGLYFPSSGERLAAFQDEAAVASRLFLRNVTIEP